MVFAVIPQPNPVTANGRQRPHAAAHPSLVKESAMSIYDSPSLSGGASLQAMLAAARLRVTALEFEQAALRDIETAMVKEAGALAALEAALVADLRAMGLDAAAAEAVPVIPCGHDRVARDMASRVLSRAAWSTVPLMHGA